MKVIDLGNRIIFADDIQYIYNKERTGEYHNYIDYYIATKVGNFEVDKYEYENVKEYLLSLNKEDKSPLSEVQRLFNKLDNQDQEYVLNILRIFKTYSNTKKS